MGLHVGAANVQQYFPRGVNLVELELDHLRIVCGLEPSFWDGRPEIHDTRLSLWLEAKRLGGKITAAPAPMAMIPSGQHAFRLEVIAKDAADYALTSARSEAAAGDALGAALPTPLIAPVIAFDRRQRSVAHQPERRRVGKLKSNDSPSSAAGN
jgi:hypothetical protein